MCWLILVAFIIKCVLVAVVSLLEIRKSKDNTITYRIQTLYILYFLFKDFIILKLCIFSWLSVPSLFSPKHMYISKHTIPYLEVSFPTWICLYCIFVIFFWLHELLSSGLRYPPLLWWLALSHLVPWELSFRVEVLRRDTFTSQNLASCWVHSTTKSHANHYSWTP